LAAVAFVVLRGGLRGHVATGICLMPLGQLI